MLAHPVERRRIDRQAAFIVPTMKFASYHSVACGKHVEERPHDQRVLDARAMANPLQHHAVVVERVAHQREVLLRIDVARAGMAGLDDVGRDDVEAPLRQRQEIAAVVDANVDVGPR